MKISPTFIRITFACICILVMIANTTTPQLGGFILSNVIFGLFSGLGIALILIALDAFVLKKSNLRTFNVLILGLFFGYLMGLAVTLLLDEILNIGGVNHPLTEYSYILKTILFLITSYTGITLTAKAADELYLSIPFIRLKASQIKKKDLLVDWTILMDSRILDLASSGLLDDHLIMPKFMLKELYMMLESVDDTIKSKAKRCLEMFKKLEATPSLDMRYSEVDFFDVRDPALKLMQLAQNLDANIITGDITRLQPYAIDSVRIINIHMLSNALKPMTGEQLSIKIQRYGKEPRQGVGYLDDGTMVVVNGGAEFIGETIKAHILSVKHTTSGRMIFCNAHDEALLMEESLNHISSGIDMSSKSYYSL